MREIKNKINIIMLNLTGEKVSTQSLIQPVPNSTLFSKHYISLSLGIINSYAQTHY